MHVIYLLKMTAHRIPSHSFDFTVRKRLKAIGSNSCELCIVTCDRNFLSRSYVNEVASRICRIPGHEIVGL